MNTQRANSIAPNDHNVPSAGNDGVSSLTWSPTFDHLLATNWDSEVRLWEVQRQGDQVRSNPVAAVKHENNAPVLDACFAPDGKTVFSAGCDNAIRMWQVGQTPNNTVPQQIGSHAKPVKGVRFLNKCNLVVSGGWDNKLKFWDARSPNAVGEIDVGERVWAMDAKEGLLVVGTANRQLLIYDVTGAQPREHTRKESPLKYQTRCISCFPDGNGFAVGSIEGRVGIQYVQRVPGKESFAFKCHRQDNNAYSVNCIAFQKLHGTFATVGSDGVVNFWDKDNKQRLKGFTPIQRTVPCAAFNERGDIFAYASSYDWTKGSMHLQPGNEIYIHAVNDDEIRPKNKKAGFKR